MVKVIAGITTSVDGYVAGPDDGPSRGLGIGGERLHDWVFGGPWTYRLRADGAGERGGQGMARPCLLRARQAVVGCRWTYEAADHWGGTNLWDVPFFIVTHRPEEQPEGAGSHWSPASRRRSCRRKQVAGEAARMGGEDIIRRRLLAVMSTSDDHRLSGHPRRRETTVRGLRAAARAEHLGVRQSRFATFIDYRVVS